VTKEWRVEEVKLFPGTCLKFSLCLLSFLLFQSCFGAKQQLQSDFNAGAMCCHVAHFETRISFLYEWNGMLQHTAKTLYRKFETNIPRKGTARLRSQFLHSCFCERFIYSHDRSAYSAAGKYVDRSWDYINPSQTLEYGNGDWGRAVPFLEIHKS
jgi:hypothetical protein